MLLQRLIGLAGYGGNGGQSNKQVQPTFGVSFGLPQPSHGGYPINPFNSNPLQNPYGPALNSGGLNLGLVSVNPLLAVQVTKNDYGEKIVKPFVNLHVTPNEHVVNKIGTLFHEKKQYLLNKHEHYHHFNPHHHEYYHHKPALHYGPHIPHGPHYEPHGPHYGPHGPSYEPHFPRPPHNTFGPTYSPHYGYAEAGYLKQNQFNAPPTAATGDDDYYDDDNINNNEGADFHNPYENGYDGYGFGRTANASVDRMQGKYAGRYGYSRSLSLPNGPGANRGSQTVRFPENRKKREVTVEQSKSERIEEVTLPHSSSSL
ncbi:uncharacterized protein LOC134668951 [Cydia fagiglandana]|uniref:uncharacterized protein LOC134668951 n=1 Tax=Cydia fagiglandana TaxID=1458189 RepID=UPI002FEE3650